MLGCYNEAIKEFTIPVPLLTIIQLVELVITYFYYFTIISIILACCFNSFRRRQIESESEGLDSQDPKVWRCYYYDQFRPTIISHQKGRTRNKTSKRKTVGTKIFEAFSDFCSGACHVYILIIMYALPLFEFSLTLSWMSLVLVKNIYGPKKSFNGSKNHFFI